MVTMEKTEFITKVKNILNDFDLTNVLAIYLSGSYSLGFIKNCDDIDIHCFTKNAMDRKDRQDLVNSIRAKLKEEFDFSVSFIWHFEDEYTGANAVRLSKDLKDRKTQKLALRTYAYEFNPKFRTILYGSAEDYLGGFDILGKDKEDYLANLKYDTTSESFLHQMERNANGRTKRLYHILCGIYMIENNSYELTEEQIKNVNIAHDKTDGWEELYEWAKNELEKLTDEKN